MRPSLIQEDVPRVHAGDRAYARLAFKYEDLRLEQGEVFQLRGRANDQALANVGHVTVLAKKDSAWPCSACAKEFASESQLRAHQRRAHGGLPE